MAREAMDVCLRVLKESNESKFESYSVINSVSSNPISFEIVACTFFPDTLSRKKLYKRDLL